ncbi:MAG: DUF3391 domain-containing protein [Lysobacteraceae bacterium]
MPDTTLELIDIDRLRVGVFVQLDLHWTQHPFQFSAFLIKSGAQLEQLRGLGVQQVRWSRSRSEVEPLPAPVGAADVLEAGGTPADAGRATRAAAR